MLIYRRDTCIFRVARHNKRKSNESGKDIIITFLKHLYIYNQSFHRYMYIQSGGYKKLDHQTKINWPILMRYIPRSSSKDILSSVTPCKTQKGTKPMAQGRKSIKRGALYTVVSWLATPLNGLLRKEYIRHTRVYWNVVVSRCRG